VASPEVPIEVDPATGIWRTDGLPMVYLPRHFLVNNHLAVEEALGLEAYREILRAATDKSALHWCRAEAKTHGLAPEATFRHYFKRLSQRGWGRFVVEMLDLAERRGRIAVTNSVFVLERGENAERPVCYMFEGFMTGAFRFLIEAGAAAQDLSGALFCREAQCAAGGGHRHCRFEFGAGEAN
jgi:predicted hydrocarbon binding protein